MKVRWFFVLSTILIALGIVADRAEELLGGSYSRFYGGRGSPLRMDDPTGNPEVIDQTPVSGLLTIRELSRASPTRNAQCGHRYGGRCPSLAFSAVSNLR